MTEIYKENQVFTNKNFTEVSLQKGIYELCTFSGCNFNSTNLNDMRFIDCAINDCNLSLASINNTAFRNIKFTNCKLLGLNFESCNNLGFEVGFKNCILDHCSFYKLRLKKTIFEETSLIEADFTETNLQDSVFNNCELNGTIFDRTNLERADFTTSKNFIIDPENNKIKRAKFSLAGLAGLVAKYDIKIELG